METNTQNTNTSEPQGQETHEKDIGAVWVKKSSNGAQFLSLNVDLNQYGINQKVNLVAFKNKNKKDLKHPDFRIFVSNREAAIARTASTPTVPTTDLDI